MCVLSYVVCTVYRELLPLCKEVMSLLYTSGRLLGNNDSSEAFFTSAHTHWSTITGKSFIS